jgi:hypothetical protein
MTEQDRTPRNKRPATESPTKRVGQPLQLICKDWYGAMKPQAQKNRQAGISWRLFVAFENARLCVVTDR